MPELAKKKMRLSHSSLLRLLRTAIALFLFSQTLAISLAQDVTESEVKAAYLFNFAKFVEWPDRAFATATSPFRFCILNDHFLELELSRIVRNKTIGRRAINVVSVRDGGESRGCQLLFAGESQNRQMREISSFLKGSSVLIVGETQKTLEQGGIIAFVSEHNHVYFQVNHRAAKEAQLYISSRLLEVAKRVIE